MLVYTFASPEDRLIQLSIFWDAYASNRLVVQIAMISHPDRVLIGLSTHSFDLIHRRIDPHDVVPEFLESLTLERLSQEIGNHALGPTEGDLDVSPLYSVLDEEEADVDMA